MVAQPDDEVDALITEWAAHLPDVDLTPLDVMSRLRRVAGGLAQLRRSAFDRAGLAPWEFDVLSALRRAGATEATEAGELSASRLTKATMVGTPAMSHRLKLLHERGLIDRRGAAHDRRMTIAALTDEGRRRVDLAMRELVEAERVELAALGATERDQLEHALRVLAVRLASDPAE